MHQALHPCAQSSVQRYQVHRERDMRQCNATARHRRAEAVPCWKPQMSTPRQRSRRHYHQHPSRRCRYSRDRLCTCYHAQQYAGRATGMQQGEEVRPEPYSVSTRSALTLPSQPYTRPCQSLARHDKEGTQMLQRAGFRPQQIAMLRCGREALEDSRRGTHACTRAQRRLSRARLRAANGTHDSSQLSDYLVAILQSHRRAAALLVVFAPSGYDACLQPQI